MNYTYFWFFLVVTSLMGCSLTSENSYEDEAKHQTTDAIEKLVNRTIESRHSIVESKETLNELTDLVDIPELTEYIQQALQSNPSLQQSIIALNIAYSNQNLTRADLLPSATSSFTGQKVEKSENSFNSDLTLNWELDVWQKLADTNNAAKTDILATEANLQTVKNLIVVNLMKAWLEISVNQQLLIIENNRLIALTSNDDLILERYRYGLETLEELDNARTLTEKTKATIAEYEQDLAESKRDLLLLTGGWNRELADINVATDFPKILYPLERLSVQDLSGRPDLQAAFFNIKAEALRTKAAYKALLPSFSLSASLSDMSETPSEALFKNPVWSLLGQISAPLFQGGALRAQAKIAELTTEQSYWVYQETLLDAVNEVENAIGQESALAAQQLHLRNALESAKRSLVSNEQNYRQGLVDIFDLLTVQQLAYDAEALLASTTYLRLLNRIELGLALGIGVSL